MLTIPRLQANCYRLELLAHLVVACCRGSTAVTNKHVAHWLNRQLGHHSIAAMEDPPEDVFVSNVITGRGDFLVLGGLWEVPDAATSLLVQTIESHVDEERRACLDSSYALLKLSDFVLKRAGLCRWQIEPSIPNRPVTLGPDIPWHEWIDRARLSLADLSGAGISVSLLEPFIFDLDDAGMLLEGNSQESELHAKPLVRIGDTFFLAIAPAVSYAVRRRLLREALRASWLDELQGALMDEVMARTIQLVRISARHIVESVHVPASLSHLRGLCQSVVFRLGQRRFVHLLFLADSLEQFARSGLLRPSEPSEIHVPAVLDHISKLRDYVDSTYEVDSGHTIALFGHLGQAFALPVPSPRERWTNEVCRLHDLTFLLRGTSGALDKLVLLLSQHEAMEQQELHISNVNGLLNLYAFWEQHGYNLRAPEVSRGKPVYIQLATDHLTDFRLSRRRSLDEHCEPTISGRPEYVVHANSEAVYESLRVIPAYVSTARLERDCLSFCLSLSTASVWISVLASAEDRALRHVSLRLWESLQLLVFRALDLAKPPLHFTQSAVEVLIDLRGLVDPQQARDNQVLSDEIEISLHKRLPLAKVVAGPGLLRRFGGVDNRGEQFLLTNILAALRMITGTEACLHDCGTDALAALGGVDAKVLHAFESIRPIDRLLSERANPIFQRPDEHVGTTMRDGFDCLASYGVRRTLDLQESSAVLNAAVADLLEPIARFLKRFDKRQMVERLLFLHETLLRDKQQWGSTARAVRALYGETAGMAAAGKAERERSEATLTIRALIEAAVCECASHQGKSPDDFSLDELYGLMCTLITLGRDSDTIYHKLSTKGITVHPSGTYSFDPDLLSEFGLAYSLANFSASYVAAAADYESWVLPKSGGPQHEDRGEFDTAEFRIAFEAEYGLGFPELGEIVGALLDACVEREEVVLEFSTDELDALCGARNLKRRDIDAFLRAFSLRPRKGWAPQPPVQASDVQPWRFERRLSVMLRPIIECEGASGPMYLYGAGTVRYAIGYVLDSITGGRFDKDVFSSREMRSYIGRRVDAAGRDFTRQVATELRKLGWKTDEEVKMTRLGAPKFPDLGDIDVLAWVPDGHILAIECKRLKAARSVSEIAQTCSRFAGNEGDHLHKHLRRLAWLEANRDSLARFVGLPSANILLHAPLVTSAVVPFAYLKGLPLQSENILPLSSLLNYLSRLSL
jgi:hypothetical protein